MLNQDRLISYRDGAELAKPVAAGAKIFAVSLVCLNAAGFLVPGSDTAGLKFEGMALEYQDNTGGQNGDLMCRLRRIGVVNMDAVSITQAMVGQIMYVASDHEFDDSSNNGVVCGRLMAYISAIEGEIDIGVAALSPATPLAADDMTVGDPGAFFPAAQGTVKTQIQALALMNVPILIPRQATWTKDAADHQVPGPGVALPFPCRIKEAYGSLGTVPGATKTLLVKFGATTLLTFGAADATKKNEALNIAVPAQTALFGAAGLLLNETAAGAGADLDLYLVVALDDGE
jgi:hypothetical protein